jgi:hypothetical protein
LERRNGDRFAVAADVAPAAGFDTAVLAGAARHFLEIVEIGRVVFAGTRMLHRLPRREQAQAVHTPATDAGQMLIRLFKGKGPPDETDSAVIRKIGWIVGAAIRIGHLAVSPQVETPKQDHASRLVYKMVALDPDAVHVSIPDVLRATIA